MSYNSPNENSLYAKFDNKKGLAIEYNETLNRRLKHYISYYNERGFITGTSHSHCTLNVN